MDRTSGKKDNYVITMKKMIIHVLIVEALVMSSVVHGLSMGYYIMSCPLAELIVTNTVTRALQSDPTLAAGLIRMHFHDCFIQGCDASVLIDSTKGNKAEKDSPANLSLRGFEVIDDAKEKLERQCPGVVSCADIVNMAARDAVFFAGGPVYDIPKGRKDGRRSKIEDTINLPRPSHNSTELIKVFSQHGFSAQEMVALSGAHTLGVARCSSFKDRLENFDSTNDVDPSIDVQFVKALSRTCTTGGDTAEQPFDTTRNNFDNDYYMVIQRKAGVLTSDQTLYANPKTRAAVNAYAMNQDMFFLDFQKAMLKMSLLDVKQDSDSDGEVRQNCRKIN